MPAQLQIKSLGHFQISQVVLSCYAFYVVFQPIAGATGVGHSRGYLKSGSFPRQLRILFGISDRLRDDAPP